MDHEQVESKYGFEAEVDNTTDPLNAGGIGKALEDLWNGNRVARSGWNGEDQYIELQVPDEDSKMTLPYIFISTVQGDLVPWLASQTDILANDWYVVRDSYGVSVPLEGNEQALSAGNEPDASARAA